MPGLFRAALPSGQLVSICPDSSNTSYETPDLGDSGGKPCVTAGDKSNRRVGPAFRPRQISVPAFTGSRPGQVYPDCAFPELPLSRKVRSAPPWTAPWQRRRKHP